MKKKKLTKTIDEKLKVATEADSIKDEKIRQRIMVGAMDEFMRFGYSKVTMDEIATHLAMSKKTIYKHFSSKEDLLFSSITHMMQCMHKDIEPLIESEDDFLDKMMKMGKKVTEAMINVPVTFLHDIQKNAPEVWKMFMEFRKEKIRNSFSNFLQAGIDSGYFRTDLPKELIVDMYFTINQNMIVPNYVLQSGMTPPEIFSKVIKVFMEGIFTTNGRQEYISKGEEYAAKNNYNFFLRTNE